MGTVHKCVTDLGAAAFIMMHKYRVIGKRGKGIYFEVPEEEVTEIDSLIMEYLASEFHRFDSCIMSLKKIGEYMPHEFRQ